jgi:hypothetical protein
MRTRTSHKLVIGLMGAMILSAGCTADQLQRIEETIDVADRGVGMAMHRVQQGAKTVACLQDKKTCLKKSAANQNPQSDAATVVADSSKPTKE